MSEHIIVTCTICNNVWDMDMMPDKCECEDLDQSVAVQFIELIETNDWRATVHELQARIDAASQSR